MSQEEDWLLRPVLRGLCRYESLVDGSLNLIDVAIMNEALDVDDLNRAKFQEWARRNDG